ncbi:MAG: peptidylprolyl isomerase [Euryarchaeota archaeon TMED248]|nr:MAG: peptidylprolyl isomerase [Euryarchaeota archaeon TMED248]|tara:strand:+ start:2167 stop:2706 length:540 start_codon:yes stop_codon:yes gene_type:complete
MTENIENDTIVSVHYTGTLPDSGETFDSSEGREPLTFIVGHKQMIPGFERELMGAKVGDKVEFTLAPEDAYGMKEDAAIMKIPRSQFAQLEESTKLEVGFQLVAQMPHGPAPFTVTDLDDDTVTADFNHALAGKTLKFNVEVVSIRSATEGESQHGHVHESNETSTKDSSSSCNDDGCC